MILYYIASVLPVWVLAANLLNTTPPADTTAMATFRCDGQVEEYRTAVRAKKGAAAMSGTYSIGVAGADFKSFTAAIKSLQQHGVSGPVTLLVKNGRYKEQLSIPEIPGASEANTITFRSASEKSAEVALFSTDQTNGNFTLHLDGADYMRFEHLTIARKDQYCQQGGRVIVLEGGACHNQFTGLRIQGLDAAVRSSTYSLVYSANDNDNHNQFSNCLLKGGSHGFDLRGQQSQKAEQGTTIEYCELTGQYAKGICLKLQDGLKLSHNHISGQSSYQWFSGIYLTQVKGAYSIVWNRVSGNLGAFGLFLSNGQDKKAFGLIAHNRIAGKSTGTCTGMGIHRCKRLSIANNYLVVKGQGAENKALWIDGQNKHIEVLGNKLACKGDGYSYVLSEGAKGGITVSEANLLYTDGSFIAMYGDMEVRALEDWRRLSGKDAKSQAISTNGKVVLDLNKSPWKP